MRVSRFSKAASPRSKGRMRGTRGTILGNLCLLFQSCEESSSCIAPVTVYFAADRKGETSAFSAHFGCYDLPAFSINTLWLMLKSILSTKSGDFSRFGVLFCLGNYCPFLSGFGVLFCL